MHLIELLSKHEYRHLLPPQRLGLDMYEDRMKRIPRAEVEVVEKVGGALFVPFREASAADLVWCCVASAVRWQHVQIVARVAQKMLPGSKMCRVLRILISALLVQRSCSAAARTVAARTALATATSS